ncbi:hypothetical protein ANAPH2_01491 [Anaplasma phagocytophilum]|nr:hypothetical protein ANAPH2_01491 [Anaplasma phagocytophilum]
MFPDAHFQYLGYLAHFLTQLILKINLHERYRHHGCYIHAQRGTSSARGVSIDNIVTARNPRICSTHFWYQRACSSILLILETSFGAGCCHQWCAYTYRAISAAQ